ncbi:MAG: stage 0 sporulation family protein [Clostridia bacterium]|nr:stage 0 sporulation family protein [Clostridia bacterium]
MTKVVGVKFKSAGRTYYFDPCKFQLKQGDNVIVETARGREYGTIYIENTEVKDEEIRKPLKPVIRIATAEDEVVHKEHVAKKEEALRKCEECITKRGLDMKLIDVEYIFDGNKVIFYFTADGRVDFRELVKDLASVFKMRIELRQIGVRDEAKMIGGVGSCGRTLCCNSWLSDFQPVSIKMAKTQNLSLNPTKISGICGRLLCCLKYENDIYLEFKKGMPNDGERVKIKEGIGRVQSTVLAEGLVKIRLIEGRDDDGKEILSDEILQRHKDEVKRLDKSKKEKDDDIYKELDSETLKEIEALTKE